MGHQVVDSSVVRDRKGAILVLLQERTRTKTMTWESLDSRPGHHWFVASDRTARWLLSWDASGQPEILGVTNVGVISICGHMVSRLWNEVLDTSPRAKGVSDETDVIDHILRGLRGA